jgi:signal transduction histidine kinase
MGRRPLRALIVEDVEDDALLTIHELRSGGFDVTHERVDTPEAMTAALERQAWDVVLADYCMPHFSAPAAFCLMRAIGLDLPFIIVSGVVGDDCAVEAMRAGVHDFLPKGGLARLVPAVERELRDAAVRAERKTIRERLLISERMASIGMLAAGIVHEINNPLASLMANLEVLSIKLSRLPTELQPAVADAQEAANRVRLIAQDLRILSRPSADHERRGPVDIRCVLDSALRMAGNEIRHRARLVQELSDVPHVEGNDARLGQVFLNLLMNAAQSIPEGRPEGNEIRITTRVHDQHMVAVEIRDTGSGIAPEHLPRLFDPFFTTKPPEIGTGLGLSICHRIVSGFGGRILVESVLGKGTVFRTLLPIASSARAEVT